MKNVVVAAGLLACLVLAPNAYAGPYTPDLLVGDQGYDQGTDCAGFANFAKCEEGKLEAQVGSNLGTLVQIDTTASNWTQVGTNLWAFDLWAFRSQLGILTDITTFAIKIGTGGAPASGDDFFVYTNVDSLQYAVINLQTLSGLAGKNLNIGSISHVATVPEPGSLLLIGVGALTAAAAHRRQRSRQGQVVSPA